MSKTVQELMRDRIKVIADYYQGNKDIKDNKVKAGDIFMNQVPQQSIVWRMVINNQWVDETIHNPQQYPHLFKKLEWWEEREFSDLPEYIKWTSPGDESFSFFKVDNWYSSPNTNEVAGVDVRQGRLFIKDCQPATLTEYNQYIASTLNKEDK